MMQESQRRLLTGLLVAVVVLGGAAVASRFMNQTSARVTMGKVGQTFGRAGRIAFRMSEIGGRVDTSSFTAQELGVERLTPAQLSAQLPGWTLVKGAAGTTFVPAKGGYPLYVGLLQGQVAVFFGPPRYGWVDQLTGLKASALGSQDVQRLSRGVPVQSVADAWQMLEGLSG
jgi:hypothetical protein